MFFIDHVSEKIIAAKKMEEAFSILKSYPLLGDFMAYQLATDINYSDAVSWREDGYYIYNSIS